MSSLIIIIVLLALNAFFVAAEFALVKAKTVRLESAAAMGGNAAKLTMRIQGNLESYLAACQLGITMASLGLGWVGEPAVAAILEPIFHAFGVPEALIHTISFIVGFLIFSSLHIVVGEQVPKTFAIRQAERVSVLIAYPLHLSYLLVWPLNWVLNWSSRSILSLFNVEEATHGDVFTDDELKDLVSVSHSHGSMEQQKADMLRNLFEFDQHNVQRVMIPRHAVTFLDVASSAEENRRTALASGHSRFPLIDSSKGSHILGVVLVKTLYRAMVEHQDTVNDPWENLTEYCGEALVVPEAQKTAAMFDLMREHRNHIAIVVNEYGSLSGIVTLEDLLEEIVGDIEDETDTAFIENRIASVGDNAWRADGVITLSDLERYLNIKLDDDLDANSLSGMLMERLERMPVVGDRIEESGYEFVVSQIRESRVGQVEIRRLEPLTPLVIDPKMLE